MSVDKLQLQRFELKYLITERVALAMRDFVSGYLVLDEFSVGQPNFSYPNHSLYLDSSDLSLYWDVINGNRNRYKLRVRYYNDDASTPVFCEIKQRNDAAILKQRCPVRREALAGLLYGEVPSEAHLFKSTPRYLASLQRFCHLMHAQGAKPKTHVAYLREAWMTEADNSVRVTFDRQVASAKHTSANLKCDQSNPVRPWGNLVILELKFTGRFPNWFGELVRIFGVMQCGVAKYAEGVALLGEQRFPGLTSTLDQIESSERFIQERKHLREGESKSETVST
jgi:hypothetical protein